MPPLSMVTLSVNMNDFGSVDEARIAGSFNAGMDSYRLDVSQLNTGMYFLQLQLEGAVTVRWIIKQ